MNEALVNGSSLKINPSDRFKEAFILHLADNSLIMGHRLSEWTGHGPMLEQDIALTNIALDLIGQSRNFYQYAALIKNSFTPLGDADTLASEDSLAYLRNIEEFKNILLTELPNGDWAKTLLKLFFFSTYQYLLYEKLVHSTDKQLSAISEKSLKEVTYHVRWSSEWVIRLGDGTKESHNRLQAALNELWEYVNEMFIPSDYEIECADNIGVDVTSLKPYWISKVKEVFDEATVHLPKNNHIKSGGKNGIHTPHLMEILNDMQYLQRTYPGCKW
ncbi:MAG: 1,2-phenylacetyl-CoA epoxidase subunit PaaC [Ginsengibacter sp.]